MEKPELLVHKAGMSELNALRTLIFDLQILIDNEDTLSAEEKAEALADLFVRFDNSHQSMTSLIIMFSSLAHAVTLGRGEIFLEQVSSSLQRW